MSADKGQVTGAQKFSFFGDADYGYGGSVSTDEESPNDAVDEERLWNSFKCTEPQARSGSMVEKRGYEVLLRVIKFILYILFFFLTLTGSVISKATALLAVSQISGHSVTYCHYVPGREPGKAHYVVDMSQKDQLAWVWCVIFMFTAPEGLTLLRFIFNWCLIGIKFPKLKYLGLLTLIEVLQSFGLALLFLVALPNLDVIQAATALTCVCVVPSVLSLFTNLGRSKTHWQSFSIYGDIITLVCQVVGLICFIYLSYENENIFAPWTLPIALILSSFRYWPNFISDESDFEFIKCLVIARRNLQAFRPVLIGYTSLLRVITFVLSALLIITWKGIEPKTFFESFNMKHNYTVTTAPNDVGASTESYLFAADQMIPITIFLINAFASLCVYGCAKFACRTLMQGVGCALPLQTAVPATVAFLWVVIAIRNNDECAYHNILDIPDHLFYWAPADGYATKWYSYAWLLWFLSQLWMIRHVWNVANKRLAAADKIFATFSYDALIVDQSIGLSRWREEPEDDDYFEKIDKTNSPKSSDDKNVSSSTIQDSDYVTRIYACATMWHETSEEMTDFLNSILRLDRDQCIMRILRKDYCITSPDYYELEVHVFFDDAFKCIHNCVGRCIHDENKTQVNDWVVEFVNTVEKCLQARHIRPSPPIKYPTPYGGRLVWTLPEKTKMYVHLKDKNRIRTRKRWSQVMYMYYLLGYRLMQLPIDVDRKEVIAENTYILTLDGDIDFRPSAMRTLIDRMKINKDLGSACGRIHPLGKGPLVWFQQFEYAIGHWLQKSTEHTIGSVLCSPGCFALFRAKALMDYNVMRKYASIPEEARHFIQYDQGEDRWLCTLILQKGYKVEYSAASDAYTHAPEGFNEFFIQRRRWIPSTVANIMDLLETSHETKKTNPDISSIFIFYQWILMGSTIFGPGTIFLMLVGAFVAAFRIGNWESFYYNLIPVLIFCIVCYFCKEKTQLTVAAIITALYGMLMIVVLVGVMIQISEDGWLAPTTVLLLVVVMEFVVTALLHPLEFGCLKYACIYYVTVPSMYLLLIVFSLFNMNNISWGTRDVPKPPEQQQAEQAEAASKNKKVAPVATKNRKNEKGSIEFSIAGLFRCLLCTHERPPENEYEFKEMTTSLLRIEERLEGIERGEATHDSRKLSHQYRSEMGGELHKGILSNGSSSGMRSVNFVDELEDRPENSDDLISEFDDSDDLDGLSVTTSIAQESDNFLISPNWLHGKDLGKGEVEYLKSEEEEFWREFIGRYLEPIDKDEKREADIAKRIRGLRDQYIFKFFMLNALFVLIIFLMQLNKEMLHLKWPVGMKYNITYNSVDQDIKVTSIYLRLEPIGFVFILGFLLVLVIQFIAMLFHRFDTFSHIMAKVSLDFYCCDKAMELSEEAIIEREAEKITKELQRKIDNDTNVEPHRNTLSPRKRMTIHQIQQTDRKQSYAASFGAALQRNLNASDGKGNLQISKRLSRVLQRRRTVVQNERQQQRQKQRPENDIYATADSSFATPEQQSPAPATLYGYDNPSFVKE